MSLESRREEIALRGERLLKLKEAGLTATELAQHYGLTRDAVNKALTQARKRRAAEKALHPFSLEPRA
jgi:uncharacterized protein (DUF433 family)